MKAINNTMQFVSFFNKILHLELYKSCVPYNYHVTKFMLGFSSKWQCKLNIVCGLYLNNTLLFC